MKLALLPINSINLKKDCYPRNGVNRVNVMRYAGAMKTGEKFPYIVVAKIRSKYYLVDGMHRLEAEKYLKHKQIQTQVDTKIKNFNDLYLESVKANMTHGQQLSIQEKIRIYVKLKDMKYSIEQIAKIVLIPATDLKRIATNRITHSVSGKEVVLKKPMKHLNGSDVEEGFDDIQKDYSGQSQISVIDELISLIQNNTLNFNSKQVLSKLRKLNKLIDDILS